MQVKNIMFPKYHNLHETDTIGLTLKAKGLYRELVDISRRLSTLEFPLNYQVLGEKLNCSKSTLKRNIKELERNMIVFRKFSLPCSNNITIRIDETFLKHGFDRKVGDRDLSPTRHYLPLITTNKIDKDNNLDNKDCNFKGKL